MSQVLYRKYRSKALSEIVGQDHIVTTLKNAIRSGKISHAYLFTGPRGVGKTSVARILAHEVNEIPYSDGLNLDIIEIDAASNRRIEEVRDLRDKVHIAPTSSKYKVYIIDEVHMLTREAFNALLKTLEEPPAHVIFILATTESHKLPETIVSRTQRFQFKPINVQDAVKHLQAIAKKEKIDVSEEALELLAIHGNGSFRDSISLLDQVRHKDSKITADDVAALLGLAPKTLIVDLGETALNGDVSKLADLFEEIRVHGINITQLAKQQGEWFRNYLLSNPDLTDKLITKIEAFIRVPASSQPDLAFELALLNIAALEAAPSRKSEANHIKSQPEAPKQVAEQVEEMVISNSGFVSQKDWNKILADIKTENNTLYGILKMAKISSDAKALVLTFGFPFHKKRAEETNVQKLLKKQAKEITGLDITIKCVLDDSLRVAPTQSEPKQDSKTLQTVSNIFGNAELLES